MNEKPLLQTTSISRRAFVAAGGVAVAAVGAGLTLPYRADADAAAGADVLAGNVVDDAGDGGGAALPVATLRVDGDRFFVDGDAEGVEFFYGHLSVMPDVASGQFVVHFYDPDGQDAVVALGDLGSAIEVHGELKTLTVDGVRGEGLLTIAPDAAIGILGVGSVGKVVFAGTADLFGIVGDADATLESGSEVGILVLGHRLCDAYVEEGAEVIEVKGLGEAQLSGPGAEWLPFIEVDREWVEELCENQHDEIAELALSLAQKRAALAKAQAEAQTAVASTSEAPVGSAASQTSAAPTVAAGTGGAKKPAIRKAQGAKESPLEALFGVRAAYAEEPDEPSGGDEPAPAPEPDPLLAPEPDPLLAHESDPAADPVPDPDPVLAADPESAVDPGPEPAVDPEPAPEPEPEFVPEPGAVYDTEEVPDVPDDGGEWAVAEEGSGEEPPAGFDPYVDEGGLEFPPDAAVPAGGPAREPGATDAAAVNLLISGLGFIGSATAGSVVSYGTGKILDLVFGTDPSTADIIAQLDAIEGRLTEISGKLSEIINMLAQLEYATQVNNFMNTWVSKIQTAFDFIDDKRAAIDAMADGDAKEAAQKEFAEKLYAGTDPSYQVAGLPVYTAAKNYAFDVVNASVTTGCDLFKAFDNLCLRRYRWEHHGYGVRADFQNMVLALCNSLMAYSSFCLNEHVLALMEDPDHSVTELQDTLIHWGNLFGSQGGFAVDYSQADDIFAESTVGKCQMVIDTAEAEQLVELDGSLRRYQVPGHEVLLCARASNVSTSSSGKTKQAQMMRDSAGHLVVLRDQFKNMLSDYGGGASLIDILFGKSEGDIVPPGNTSLDFVCYQQPLEQEKHMTHPGHTRYYEYYAPFLSATGSESRKMLAKITTKQSTLVKSVSAIGVFRA